MSIEELILYRSQFKTIVYLKGLVASRKNDISTLTRYDKNDSHKQAILNAIKYFDEAKATLKEKLDGGEYEYMMLSLRQATALYNSGRKKNDMTKFNDFNPFKKY